MSKSVENEGIEKTHEIVLLGGTPAGESRQPTKPEEEGYFSQFENEIIKPPVDLDQLAKLSQSNTLRKSIIDAIARNTVGLGYSITVGEGHEDDTDESDLVAMQNTLEALARRDKRLDSPSFTELMYAIKTDEEETGQGYMEISRSRLTGMVDGIFHAPGRRIRKLKDRSGYVMLPVQGDLNDENKVYFYNFGEKVAYDENSLPQPRLQSRGKRWQRNELISFRLYTSETRDYGLPRDIAMLLEYAGDKLAAQSNVSFFDSSGTPPSIIFVRGEEAKDGGRITFKVPPSTATDIAELLKSDGGHHHRVAIVPLPPGSSVDHVELGKISERDVGFVEYRRDNRRRALGTFRIAPIFIADTDDSGRYTAEVERAITLEQVFDPEQRRYESRLRETLLKDLGKYNLQLTLKRLAVESDAARRESAERMAEVGAITRGEFRDAMGWPPLVEADDNNSDPEPGLVPFGWNSELVDAGRPRGADNRTLDAEDQRGLRPGIGGRVEKSHGVPHVEDEVDALSDTFQKWLDNAMADGMKRTMTLGHAMGQAVAASVNGGKAAEQIDVE